MRFSHVEENRVDWQEVKRNLPDLQRHEFTEDQILRFWSKVDRSPGQGPNGDCWQWTAGAKHKIGYGGFYLKQIDNTINCHKFVYLLVHNYPLDGIGKEFVVRHLCNNPQCVNPRHLALGTHKDNSEDMVRSGNSLRGEKGKLAKLTWDKVREIRECYASEIISTPDLAKRFGISPASSYAIVSNKHWVDDNYVVPERLRTPGRQKFDAKLVEVIRKERESGVSVLELHAKYGMSTSQIYNIINNRQRKGVVE